MKIYTKTGDQGTTSVIGAQRLDKDDMRVEAYGAVEELSCFIGMAVTFLEEPEYTDVRAELVQLQHALFGCGTDLATLEPNPEKFYISAEHVEAIERLIDHYDEELEELRHFILPGGTRVAAALHQCRAVARRAERRVTTLYHHRAQRNEEIQRYLNRLSDLFFTMARICNARAGLGDVLHIPEKNKKPGFF